MNDTFSAFVLPTISGVTGATWALVGVTILLAVATWQLVKVTRHHNERHEARLEFKSIRDVARYSIQHGYITFRVEFVNTGWKPSAIRYAQVQSAARVEPRYAKKVNLFHDSEGETRDVFTPLQPGDLARFKAIWKDYAQDASFEDLLEQGFDLYVEPVLGRPMQAHIKVHDTNDPGTKADHPRRPRIVNAHRIDIPERFENA